MDKQGQIKIIYKKSLYEQLVKLGHRPIAIEKGLVKHGWVLGEWDCLLSEEDAAYVQPHQNYGSWSKIIQPTIEECKSILKAKQLRDIGLRMLQEETNGTT